MRYTIVILTYSYTFERKELVYVLQIKCTPHRAVTAQGTVHRNVETPHSCGHVCRHLATRGSQHRPHSTWVPSVSLLYRTRKWDMSVNLLFCHRTQDDPRVLLPEMKIRCTWFCWVFTCQRSRQSGSRRFQNKRCACTHASFAYQELTDTL